MNKPTVYIIDDDLSILRGLNRLVRAAGLYAELFTSAKDFLAADKYERPGCIVLDYRMPNMTGVELQKELSKLEHFMPIIFLSGQADVPTAARAMKKGAVDFLVVPFDPEALMDKVAKLAERADVNQKEREKAVAEK